MGKPDAPTPPNPIATAAAQTGTNVSTGVANAFLNNVNQNTPEGSLRYDVTGKYGWTDPSTGHTYNIPTFTSTQSLSPQQQLQKVQNDATKMNMATWATSNRRMTAARRRLTQLNAQQYLQNNPDVLGYARRASTR